MMIQSVTTIEPSNFKTKSAPSQSQTSEDNVAVEWYCNNCKSTFITKHHKKCDNPSCPYCHGIDVVNNKDREFREGLCRTI